MPILNFAPLALTTAHAAMAAPTVSPPAITHVPGPRIRQRPKLGARRLARHRRQLRPILLVLLQLSSTPIRKDVGMSSTLTTTSRLGGRLIRLLVATLLLTAVEMRALRTAGTIG